MPVMKAGPDYAQLAADAAGNWKKFESFGWHDRPGDGENWAIVYTSNRDGGLLAQSNEGAINKAMDPFTKGKYPTAVSERHSHWACGHIDGFAIRVYKKGTKQVTKAFKAWCDLQSRMGNYPLLDETDYSQREYDATIENIEQAGCGLVRDGAPTDWPGRVYSWFSDHNQGAIENRDDQGGYPNKEQMVQALAGLDLIDEDERPLDKVPLTISHLLISRVDSLSDDEAKATLKDVLTAFLDWRGRPSWQLNDIEVALSERNLTPDD